MLKQVWIAQCDLCGKEEKAKAVRGRYDEPEQTLPDGWKCGYNKAFHLCGECAAVVNKNSLDDKYFDEDGEEGPVFHDGTNTLKGCLNLCEKWKKYRYSACSMECEDFAPQCWGRKE